MLDFSDLGWLAATALLLLGAARVGAGYLAYLDRLPAGKARTWLWRLTCFAAFVVCFIVGLYA